MNYFFQSFVVGKPFGNGYLSALTSLKIFSLPAYVSSSLVLLSIRIFLLFGKRSSSSLALRSASSCCLILYCRFSSSLTSLIFCFFSSNNFPLRFLKVVLFCWSSSWMAPYICFLIGMIASYIILSTAATSLVTSLLGSWLEGLAYCTICIKSR